MADLSKQIERSFKRKEFVNNWISNCDSKSSYLLTFFGVITTIIFTSDFGESIINALHFSKSIENTPETISNFFFFVFSILFLTSSLATFYCSFLSLKARIDSSVYSQTDLISSSNIFFGTIREKEFKIFNQTATSESDEEFLSDLNSQIFINSNIASVKFKYYNLSLISMLITVGIFLLLAIIK